MRKGVRSLSVDPLRDAPDRMQRLVDRLRGPDEEDREAAADDLERWARDGLSDVEGEFLLDVACTEFPPRRFEILDTRADLIRALGFQPRELWIPRLVGVYRKLSPRARSAALLVLVRTPGPEAISALLSILRSHARSRRVRSLPVSELLARADDAMRLFPELMSFLEVADLTFSITELALCWLSDGTLEASALVGHVESIFRVYLPRRDRVRDLDSSAGLRTEEHARWVRETAMLIDLFGRIPTPAVQAELQRLVAGPDVRFQFFAACALLRVGRRIPEGVLERVAEDPEFRAWLWEELERMGKTHLYPRKRREPVAFAESELVRWLAWPAELGRVPDEVEWVETVSIEPLPGTVLDFFVFRFRLAAPHWASKEGWLAGAVGPYVRGGAAGPGAWSEAFSRFEAFSRRSPEGHVGDRERLIVDWRARLLDS